MKFLDELRSEPILLAHHPLCGKFEDHLLNIRGRRVCRGCLTVYPIALLLALVLYLVRPDFWSALIIALALYGVQLLRFLSKGQGASIVFNLMLGSSLASIIYSAIVCPAELRIYLYPFIAAVILSFEYLKGMRVLARCRDCPNYSSFPKCVTGPVRLEK
ncbi:MAG: hypothetical protein NT131_03240 [Methanomassiliicoccales archaeon]|nr:hypothetical protein [Methanomassiliicoccales archaeon]